MEYYWVQTMCLIEGIRKSLDCHMYTHVQSLGAKLLSRVRLFATPWTIAYHAPPSMRFSRQEYWSGLPFPFPEALPNPGFNPWTGKIPLKGKAAHYSILACIIPWTGYSMGSQRVRRNWATFTYLALSDPGIEPVSLVSPALPGGFFATEPPGKPVWIFIWEQRHNQTHLYDTKRRWEKDKYYCFSLASH